MKRIKKIASLLLAMVMVFAMSVTAFAADNNEHTITINLNAADKGTHTYEAYQIFAGDLKTQEDGTEVLSNIIWGKGVNGTKLLADLKTDKNLGTVFANCNDAKDVAEILADETKFASSTGSTTTATDIFARIAENCLTSDVSGKAENVQYVAPKEATDTEPAVVGVTTATITVTGSGYYLVKDSAKPVGDKSAVTRFLLEVAGSNPEVTIKSEVPGGDKQVYIDDETTGDANNAAIGSHVSYKITSAVPNHVGYNYYYFIMNDTLSNGLTFDGASTVKVTVKGAELTQGKDYYVYTENVSPKTFRLAFANIMAYTPGDPIVVTYSATVNDQAVIGTTGNPNTWNLQYSNNPDDTFDGERPDDENKPGLPAEEDSEALGETPNEMTLTYVTELDITKYANSVAPDHVLAGAEFTLTGETDEVVLKNVERYIVDPAGEYWLLVDGTYVKDAPTGTGYKEIGVGTKNTTTGYIKDDNGEYVVPSNKNDYEGKTLYKLVKGTAEKYADVNTKYRKETVTEEIVSGKKKVSIEMTTNEEGKISFRDLGAGTYTLTETVTPAGFNTLEPIEFTISFVAPEKVIDGTEECTWTIDWTGVTEKGGIFAADVINNSGSTLPSTGGIGTTIFYVVGGILVIGAGILLVTKRRMKAQ